jgi:hypothetical protein
MSTAVTSAGAMGLLPHGICRESRSWRRIGVAVAAFALAAAVWLSFVPAAGAAERFSSPVAIPTGLKSPSALTLGDFQGTGRQDIAAISSTAVSWIQDEGGGAFAHPVVTTLPNSPDLTDIATLPAAPDSGTDYVAIVDQNNSMVDIGFLSSTGFSLLQQLAVPCGASHISVADLTGEAYGSDDFAVECLDSIAIVLATPPTALQVLHKDRNPTWVVSQTVNLPQTAGTFIDDNIAAAVDSDGVYILETGWSYSTDFETGITSYVETLYTLLPSSPPGHYELEPQSPGLAAVNDGDTAVSGTPTATVTATVASEPAIIIASDSGGPALVEYVGNGTEESAPFGITLPTTTAAQNAIALTTGLFNGDSFTDLAYGEELSNGSCLIAIDTGNSTGGFTAGATPAQCGYVSDMQVGDLNGEGLDDIAYTDPGDNGLFVLYQDPPELGLPIGIGHGPVDHLDETQPVASDVGLLIQRRGKPRRVEVKVKTRTGTKQVTREVPTLITVGHIPLGPHHKGRNTIHYKLLVNGHPLRPGSYIVTLRSLNAKKQVLDLSQPVTLTVDRHGHAHFGKHVIV